MKVLYATTISNTINAFFIPHIELLLDQGHTVDIACNIKKEISPALLERGCKVIDINFQRTPLAKQNFQAYKKIVHLINNENYDLIHVHTPVAAAYVRFASRKKSNIKLIYTAHGFHFYKGAPIRNWLLYYPIEYILSRDTDVLITINKEDFKRAKSFKAKKVEYIKGVGFDSKKFSEVVVDRAAKRDELEIPLEAYCVLSVGELNKNKNHETVINAIARLNNPKIHYLICGEGPLESYLITLAERLNIKKQVKFLGYRTDIAEICKVVDLFVFPSYREGLPVAVMEAMASGLPIICSDIRGNRELIENKKNGFIIKPSDVKGMSILIDKMFKEIANNNSISYQNKEKAKEFDINSVLIKIQAIYADIN
ncbi:glycosyltransferase family 4 protein [Rummeliibacillus pycnus]|uniref:glycosyltransferase family 4 protein n=1 Tax=Rummeliibacillus pycnus TaxID=101070 RepID=UPI000C9B9F68|nr:glycosyltransferase family 4 protein [Rummeliibacillus pycnus]